MLTNYSKRCGRLRKVTLPISNAFIGKPWPTNLNNYEYLSIEENVIFFNRK